jgi:hypothetical protein
MRSSLSGSNYDLVCFVVAISILFAPHFDCVTKTVGGKLLEQRTNNTLF